MAIRNVILVVIDCLRADHLSCYGYGRETTPAIDHLARHGLLWEQAYSTCSWTKPSVASMLSGLYPSEHGVLKGPKRTRGRDGSLTDVFPDSAPHVAEAFTSSGWRCGAFFNNVQLERYTGFQRGFHTYEPICGKVDRQLEMIDQWIALNPSQPFFVYGHFMEAHWPFKPRRRHVEMFGGNRDTSRFDNFSALDFAKLRRSLKSGEATLSESDLEDLVRMYDASVRRLDGKIKILQEILVKHGVYDETALVITADHGEEFLDHGSIGHGHSLHVEATHVPLVIFSPQQDRTARYREPMSMVDLPRTLLSLAGASMEFPGCDLLQASGASVPYSELSVGRSFHRAIVVGRWRLHRHAWLDSEWDATPMEFIARVRRGELSAQETIRLYDLETDPHEQSNLADQSGHFATVRDLTQAMELPGRLPAEAIGTESPQAEVDETVVARLRDLGYIE